MLCSALTACLHGSLLLKRGSLNSAHNHGTHVPVEEPSTASKADFDTRLEHLRSTPNNGLSGVRSAVRRVPSGDMRRIGEMKEAASVRGLVI